MPTQPQLIPQNPVPASAAQVDVEAALAQSPAAEAGSILSGNSAVARLPVEIDVSVPIRKFRVRNLLALAKGEVIRTQWVQGEDMPLGARGTQLAWTEFEVVDQKLAVRITRLI
jgi:flagellar motor switch protein FliM